MRLRRGHRALAVVLASCVVLTACTADADREENEPLAATETPADPVAHEAADLRATLEQQVGRFAMTALERTRLSGNRAKAVGESVTVALGELGGTVAEVYDDEAAADFEQMWEAFAERLGDYSDRVRAGKPAGDARRVLQHTTAEMAGLMATITDGSMEEDGTTALLRAPLRSMVASVDAHAARDFDRAYTAQRRAYADIISVGRAFAAGISEQRPEEYPGPRASGAVELRSALRQLFGEHSLLTVTVVRRGARGARDFGAAAAALNGNTGDIARALDSVYGKSSTPFGALWRDRISSLADYNVAAAEQRPRRIRTAQRAVRRLDNRLARLLGDLLALDRGAARDALRAHTGGLLAQMEAYADGALDDAEQAAAAAHRAAEQLADLVAEAIIAQRPDQFPPQ